MLSVRAGLILSLFLALGVCGPVNGVESNVPDEKAFMDGDVEDDGDQDAPRDSPWMRCSVGSRTG